MKPLYVISFVIILLNTNVVDAQYGFKDRRDWARNKKELIINGGTTHFLGDLGGKDEVGSQNSLRDIDFVSTRFNLGVGYRFRFHPFFATTSYGSFGLLGADDKNTTEPARNGRNLHFRSPYVNIEQRFEVIFWSLERNFAAKAMSSGKPTNIQIYGSIGAGVMWFNPQAKYEGSWVNLRSLGTEGQGLEGGPKKYLPITATIPISLGFRTAITQMWRIGIEMSLYKTFSNYIDDVGGFYYDANAIAAANGPAAGYLSNPALKPTDYQPGDIRGKADDDAYVVLNISAAKNLTYSGYKGRTKVRKYRGKSGL